MQLAGNEGGGPGLVRLRAAAAAAGRWVLAVAVLGEAMVLLEATVVNVALPSIGVICARASRRCSGRWTVTCSRSRRLSWQPVRSAISMVGGACSPWDGCLRGRLRAARGGPDDPAACCRPVRSRGWRGSSHPGRPRLPIPGPVPVRRRPRSRDPLATERILRPVRRLPGREGCATPHHRATSSHPRRVTKECPRGP